MIATVLRKTNYPFIQIHNIMEKRIKLSISSWIYFLICNSVAKPQLLLLRYLMLTFTCRRNGFSTASESCSPALFGKPWYLHLSLAQRNNKVHKENLYFGYCIQKGVWLILVCHPVFSTLVYIIMKLIQSEWLL